MNIILSILFSLTTNTCEPEPMAPVEYTPDMGAIEADSCGAPLCTYNDGGTIVTKACDNQCSWPAGVPVTCGGWTCAPLAPASACRWACVPTP